MITALQLRYRAIQATDKSVIDDSTYWLIQGGYTEEDKKTLGVDGWKHLCNNFSQQWRSYKRKNLIPENKSHCGNRTLLRLLLELNLFQMM
jgi:hypothetical protein